MRNGKAQSPASHWLEWKAGSISIRAFNRILHTFGSLGKLITQIAYGLLNLMEMIIRIQLILRDKLTQLIEQSGKSDETLGNNMLLRFVAAVLKLEGGHASKSDSHIHIAILITPNG